ncbi:MAG: phosphate ABC transporter substrate-binding protein [Anaerolineae bacterium]|nr:phosphate ABC transporter substrate-binding protein [Anaerolineae bacterium]
MTSVGPEKWVRPLEVLLLVLGCLLTSCAATVEPPSAVQLELAGSTSMQGLVEELAGAYTGRYDWVSIDIDPRGTQLGLEALRGGAVDVALVSRELRPEETQGLEAVVIAYDAVAVIVNSQNPVDDLTTAQLRNIYSGQILVWSELGGQEADIQVVSREDGSGTREAFEGAMMQGEDVTTMAVVMPGSEAMGHFVEGNPLAVGYRSSVGIPLGTRALRIEGVGPGVQAVAQGTYPLLRPFLLVIRQDAGQDERSFVDFVLSPAGQVIVGQRYGRARH